jgi:hypothetical protein
MDIEFQRALLNQLVNDMPDNLIPELLNKVFQPSETNELLEEEIETDKFLEEEDATPVMPELIQVDFGVAFLALAEDSDEITRELDAFEAYIVDRYCSKVEDLLPEG